MPVIVCLSCGQVGSDEFIVDFILRVRQQNESRDNAGVARSLECAGNLSVPDVVVVRHQSAHTSVGHGEDQVSVVNNGLTAVNPVVLGCVTEVFLVAGHIVHVGERAEGLALANGFGGAGVEGEGIDGITTTQAVSARTALAVLYVTTRSKSVLKNTGNQEQRLKRHDLREQQGADDGHCVPLPQLMAAEATVAVKAATATVLKLTIVAKSIQNSRNLFADFSSDTTRRSRSGTERAKTGRFQERATVQDLLKSTP